MREIQKILASRIKELRDKRGWNQSVLAEKAGKSLSAIRQIETGAIWPAVETLESIAKALGQKSYRLFMTPEDLEKEVEAASGEWLHGVNLEMAEDEKLAESVLSGIAEELKKLLKVTNRAIETLDYPEKWMRVSGLLAQVAAEFETAWKPNDRLSLIISRLSSMDDKELSEVESLLQLNRESVGYFKPPARQSKGDKREKA